MPGRDGTGPIGRGPAGGSGRGFLNGRNGTGGNMNAGPGGFCICPQCGEKVPHQAGEPCSSSNCPKCGTRLIKG